MGAFVIACYRPRPGQEAHLLEVVREHMPILRSEGLVTDRASCAMKAADGTIVEVFEWKSAQAVEQAHSNPNVLAMWGRFNETCECISLSKLHETAQLFPHFEPVDV